MKQGDLRRNKQKTSLVFLLGLMTVSSFPSMAAGDVSAQVAVEQQVTTVTGVVKDVNGEPIIGASVVDAENRMVGVVTDLDGKFTLKLSGKSFTISYVGYETQQIEVRADVKEYHIVLKEDSRVMDEIVVVGYGSMKRSDVATAVASIKPEEMNLAGANSRDVRQLLDGKVAGLSITRTGGSSPNSSVAVQMRGVVSVNGSQSPLVVIDGSPGGNLDLVRSEDIESIDVLKDGSAAAIYGSQANAGVILITTKRGHEGKASVEYSTYLTHYAVSNWPDFMDAGQWRAKMTELGNPSYMQDRGGSTDWYREIINKSNLSHSHSLSISGHQRKGSRRTWVPSHSQHPRIQVQQASMQYMAAQMSQQLQVMAWPPGAP